MTARIRVLIVDDHDVVREGLGAILGQDPSILVVGEASDGQQAVEQADAHRPDIVLMDLSMPNVNGADATRRIASLEPPPKILVLSAHHESAYVRETLRAGASGYVLKRTALRDLLSAIHTVHQGGTFLDPELVSHPLGVTAPNAAALTADLSAREIDVASMTAYGYTNAEIASSADFRQDRRNPQGAADGQTRARHACRTGSVCGVSGLVDTVEPCCAPCKNGRVMGKSVRCCTGAVGVSLGLR